MPDNQPDKAHARRRARYREQAHHWLATAATMPPVPCRCGCGTQIPALTTDGKPRHYARGHRPHKTTLTPSPTTYPRFTHPAACTGRPELFFGRQNETGGEQAARLREARALCRSCPARKECLEWAVGHREEGFWAGLGRGSRERLARERREAAA